MKKGPFHEHPSAEQLQAFLDRALPARKHSGVEEHVGACSACMSELEAWRLLDEDLAGLRSHRPIEGFADRVMAHVVMPEALPLAARVGARVERALSPATDAHLEPALLQDFVDGALGRRHQASAEAHLAMCATCSAEADVWRSLTSELGRLRRFRPSAGFSDRVFDGVTVPEALPLAARIRTAAVSLLPGSASAHPLGERLQEYVDGALRPRHAARVEAHLGRCAACSSEVDSWRTVSRQLDGLRRLAPRGDFASAVMSEVTIPVFVPAVARRSIWFRAGVFARKFVPSTRKAWAAVSGAAVTPAVTVGLMLYAVFSHPTLTLGSLARFVGWQLSDIAGAIGASVASFVASGTQLFGLDALVDAVASAPAVAIGGALVYTFLSVFALRYLYKHVLTNRLMGGRYARV